MRNRKTILMVFGMMVFVALSLAIVSAYTRASNVPYSSSFNLDGLTGIPGSITGFDRNLCGAGQDFILQVSPLGCTPSVVRSDLLEEQNVPVFCPIVATQLNPLIDIKAIDHITFRQGESNPDIAGVTYYPARAALGNLGRDRVDTPILDNIGYAVVVLKQQRNGTAMPDFVSGNVTARINYDIQNAFGVGQASFYLPELSDAEWENDFRQYGFWDGRGYLRAESVDGDGATISIYSDRETNGFGNIGDKRRISTVNLRVGETSNELFMPGFEYCLGGLRLRLNDLENPDTRVRLNVNGNDLELVDGERFLENKCQVRDIDKQGIIEKTTISCNADDRRTTFNLIVSPKINLSVGGVSEEFEVGDLLYKDENPEKSVYLAYIDTRGNDVTEQNLFAMFISLPTNKVKLNEDEIASIARLVRMSGGSEITGNDLVDSIANLGKKGVAFSERILRNIVGGESFRPISFGETKGIFGTDLKINGFAGAKDIEISSFGHGASFHDNYENSFEDYETVHESFPTEKYPLTRENTKTLGEEALAGEVELAWGADQKRTATQLCEEFEDAYPNGAVPDVCIDAYKLSSLEPAVKDVVIDGRTKRISFDRIREPTFEEFGAAIFVKEPSGNVTSVNMRKNDIIYLNESANEFIQLVDVDANSAKIRGNLKARSVTQATKGFLLESSSQKLNLGETETFGSDYAITLQETNIKQVAKVSVIPEINYAHTETNFDFKIGIEKRGIQLSPEQTRDKIESINATLEKWRDRSEKLGTVVSAGKAACLAVGTTLTVKNFFQNLAGEGIARQKAMRGDGGWFEICEARVNSGEFGSVDSCLLENNDEIESAVDEFSNAMKTQNNQFKNLQVGITEESFLGEDVVDTDKLEERYIDDGYRNEMKTNLEGIDTVRVGGEDVLVLQIVDSINSDTTLLTQARDLQLNARLLNSDDEHVRAIARNEIDGILGDIWVNSRATIDRQSFLDALSSRGLGGIGVGVYQPEGSIEGIYDGGTTTSAVGSIPVGVPVQAIIYKNLEYVLQLEQVGPENYRVVEVYDTLGVKFDRESPNYGEITNKFSFKKFDRETYENEFINPRIRYYEADQYRGLPAVVPFDVDDGWYASIKSTVPIGGNIRSFDDSGRVSSFYLCNVGQNGREEFNSGIGDDVCQMINLGTGQPINQFPGLEAGEASRLVTRAVTAIEEASRRYGAGVSQVSIFGQTIEVGEPAINIPDIQCQDFMSGTDCNLLFNVCDPVICPSSRCDLGGAHPVRDVVQSGIAGSLALCLPNFPEVKVPICLTGVKAGIDGFLSVGDSYQECLQTSLETGETVGICDEIYSVHMCEFFWRQSLPIAQAALPQIVGSVLGQNVRGGGEYLGVNDAFQSAEDSVDFFTQSYAANSFRAFKARSAEGVGTEVCENFVSFTGPQGGNIFDALTAPDSPPQYYGRFDEIPFTTATNPPTSQYKVFYHIYAGNDFPAHYQVYLRDPAGSSFFQDTSFRRIVATGFINAGEYATQTEDFTAPSGFSQMCIVVNGQEECGFKQVTTDFGVNFISDQFIADEASRTDIKTEASCISGNPNFGSLINPNLQAGGEEFINPAIYNRGITRVCSTDNPGSGTDALSGTENSRWKEVGICGNQNVKCWLDSESVRDAVRTTTVEDRILDEVTDDYLEALKKEGGFVEDFEKLVEEIESEEDRLTRIEKIDENEDKVFYNFEKAYLKFLRANTYSSLALEVYEIIRGPSQETDEPPEDTGNQTQGNQTASGPETTGTEGTQTTNIGTCSNKEECQQLLGNRIIEIAREIKENNPSLVYDLVQQDTGIKNFECLALHVANAESAMRHCEKMEEGDNPLYCETDTDEILSGDGGESKGIMQINTEVHTNVDAVNFEENVNFGINLLRTGHSSTPRTYVCNGETYRGWARALRQYNGWPRTDNIDCDRGNKDYVEEVINEVTWSERLSRFVPFDVKVVDLFPECKIEASPGQAAEGGVTGN